MGCGAYGYPLREAVAITVRESLRATRDDDAIRAVTFACFGDDVLAAYRAELARAGR